MDIYFILFSCLFCILQGEHLAGRPEGSNSVLILNQLRSSGRLSNEVAKEDISIRLKATVIRVLITSISTID